ncbi:MAG: ASCH domain-containing protein [Chloroflexi bacterium]|nr:ASCH domain-containing protein [Chloroflexota bacterium]
MRAMTLWELYASAIARGFKTTETRSWAPPSELVGQRIAIHAAKRRVDTREIPLEMARQLEVDWPDWMEHVWQEKLPYGCVVATAKLADVRQVTHLGRDGVVRYVSPPFKHDPEQGVVWEDTGTMQADPYGDYSLDRILWVLEDVQALAQPVPVRGRQGLWTLPDEALILP